MVYAKNHLGDGDFDNRLSIKFGLDKQFNHFIIRSCIDLLEDTEQAIADFERFGLDGPTKFDNWGERYLRLYGLLNAVNSQKSIVITLHEIFKLPEKKKDFLLRFKGIKIIDTRHMIASHSVDYNDGNGRDFFRVSMTTVRNKGENIHIHSKDKFIQVDLTSELKEFRIVLHAELLKIVKHLLKRFVDKKSKFFKEITPDIDAAEARIEGHLVMDTINGKVIIKSKR
jgi:hypothetical protein